MLSASEGSRVGTRLFARCSGMSVAAPQIGDGNPQILCRDPRGRVNQMQPAAAPTDKNTDIASAVVATMRQLGVLGLPRNYEIFYEALSGTNRELSLAVVSLSSRPTQD